MTPGEETSYNGVYPFNTFLSVDIYNVFGPVSYLYVLVALLSLIPNWFEKEKRSTGMRSPLTLSEDDNYFNWWGNIPK